MGEHPRPEGSARDRKEGARSEQIVVGPELDPEEILTRLRAEQRVLKWEPLPPARPRGNRENEQARNGVSLEFLHRNWELPHKFDATEAGSGARGRIVALFGRLTFRVLGPYLSQERELLSHMVRVNEALEHRCDELTMRWQQLNQDVIDRQVAEARNLTELALWLHVDTSEAGTGSGSGRDSMDHDQGLP
jgi:hypothetical protein